MTTASAAPSLPSVEKRRPGDVDIAPIPSLAGAASSALTAPWFLGLTFGVLAFATVFVEAPLSHYLDEHRLGGDLLKILTLSEVFAHGYGVAAILLTAWVLMPGKSRQIGRVLLLLVATAVVVNVAKALVLRVRPEHFDLTRPALESFVGFFSFMSPAGYDGYFDFRLHSFPSGHTAMAVALAIGLTQLAPRGKYLFIGFAVLAAIQRIVTRDHFLSDTLMSAAVVILLSSACRHLSILKAKREN